MRLLIKSMLLLTLLTSSLRAEVASTPLGFQTKNYVYNPNLRELSPPAKTRIFVLPEQNYINCLPAAMVSGTYIASSYSFNTSEQLAMKILRIYVENNYNSEPNAIQGVDFMEGHLDRKGITEWEEANAETDVNSEDNISAETEAGIAGYEYVYNEGNSRYFVELTGSEITCNQDLNRFEWHLIDPLISYPSGGYLKLSYIDGKFMATGSVQRFYSILGLTLGSYGGYTEFNFEAVPVSGAKVRRPSPPAE